MRVLFLSRQERTKVNHALNVFSYLPDSRKNRVIYLLSRLPFLKDSVYIFFFIYQNKEKRLKIDFWLFTQSSNGWKFYGEESVYDELTEIATRILDLVREEIRAH